VVAIAAASATGDFLVVPGLPGQAGGRLVYGERSEPKTLNPIFASDTPSRNVANRLVADLIHINRATLKTEPALAKTCKVLENGLRYELELRQNLKFSDGHPFDADDVVFTFQVYLDENVKAPQRSSLILDGKPIAVHKLDARRVVIDLPRVNAVGERIFDGIPMLPRHLLERAWREGKLNEAWGLRTRPEEIAGLGPFRLVESVPGQRIVLERNPYYWKSDSAGTRLPYLNQLAFTFSAGEDMQVLRFHSGESDVISRITPRNYAVLRRDSARRRYALLDAGPSLEYGFLFFNLNDSVKPGAAWRSLAFRRAVSAAIDRDAIVRLVYQGYADPLASVVAAGNKAWIPAQIPLPIHSIGRAREFLRADGFKWSREGALLDSEGKNVRFSIIASSSNPERAQIATLIQADLKPLGIQVDVVQLEFNSLIARVTTTHDYEACIFALSSGDADPNADLDLWLSSGNAHLWHPRQTKPATAWEAEIDALMKQQLITPRYEERKRIFDRVHEIATQNLPLIPLVSPHVLVGVKQGLGNFRPAVMEPYALWNAEELYWERPVHGGRQ
jgi:peptide/nickel transport system substrate-binding protein